MAISDELIKRSNVESKNLYFNLNEKFEVYRACYAGVGENGISWTLNYKKAQFLAERFLEVAYSNQVVYLITANARKQDVIFTLNFEEEVVLYNFDIIKKSNLNTIKSKT